MDAIIITTASVERILDHVRYAFSVDSDPRNGSNLHDVAEPIFMIEHACSGVMALCPWFSLRKL